jgi:hypothetical protein
MIQRSFSILFACVLLQCFGYAQAQQNSVAVTPASIDARVKRGASYTQTFTLTNNTETRLRLKCSVADVWYDERNNRITGNPGTLPRSASPWVQFLPADVVVEPRSSTAVKAVITVPLTATGSYYTMPVFEALPVAQSTGQAVPPASNTAIASIGVRFRGLIILTTMDGSEYNVEILDGKISPPSASTELTIELDLRNRGTAHVRMRGAFAILNSSGALAARGTIQEKRYVPGQRNIMRVPWAGELPTGKYTSVITLTYDRVGMEPATLVYELPLVVP